MLVFVSWYLVRFGSKPLYNWDLLGSEVPWLDHFWAQWPVLRRVFAEPFQCSDKECHCGNNEEYKSDFLFHAYPHDPYQSFHPSKESWPRFTTPIATLEVRLKTRSPGDTINVCKIGRQTVTNLGDFDLDGPKYVNKISGAEMLCQGSWWELKLSSAETAATVNSDGLASGQVCPSEPPFGVWTRQGVRTDWDADNYILVDGGMTAFIV